MLLLEAESVFTLPTLSYDNNCPDLRHRQTLKKLHVRFFDNHFLQSLLSISNIFDSLSIKWTPTERPSCWLMIILHHNAESILIIVTAAFQWLVA